MSLIFGSSRLRLVRGTTWNDTLQLINETTGLPINLTGVTAILMRVRSSTGSNVVLMELSMVNNRLSIVDAVTGLIAIAVSAVDTLALPRNNDRRAKYVYDATLSRGGSPEVIEPGYKGKLTVFPQVTRSLVEL